MVGVPSVTVLPWQVYIRVVPSKVSPLEIVALSIFGGGPQLAENPTDSFIIQCNRLDQLFQLHGKCFIFTQILYERNILDGKSSDKHLIHILTSAVEIC